VGRGDQHATFHQGRRHIPRPTLFISCQHWNLASLHFAGKHCLAQHSEASALKPFGTNLFLDMNRPGFAGGSNS
jgi:hypothetical protein